MGGEVVYGVGGGGVGGEHNLVGLSRDCQTGYK